MTINSPDQPYNLEIGLYKPEHTECLGKSLATFGQVVEARLPLEIIGLERFGVDKINIAGWTDQDLTHGLDTWDDFLEVKIKEVAPPVPIVSPPIPFPSRTDVWSF